MKLLTKRVWACFACMLAVLTLSGLAYAYEVSPMRVFLVPADGRDSTTLTVNNVRDRSLPVEVTVLRRILAADGTQSFEPAEDDFLVFPPQFEVGAETSQALRIQYIGEMPTSVAQAYVVQVEEVPVVPEGFSGVKFTYNFGVAVYVEPPGAEDDLVASASAQDGILTLELTNRGNAYSLLSLKEMSLRAGSYSESYSPAEMAELVSDPLIAPRTTRTFTIALPSVPDGEMDSVNFRSFDD